ncbi:metal dependent phosphohydrolase [[Leptolyngbya] sp. PCC 7376]|uniref:HD domain-containing protein n=1 Tax=[Leptolyngbya] sp. PCC 7376 TaxID=111781 RepID=UPI00029EFAF9|nr:HD domain-containing protein [[Leptolyngbya] sp. PCC 7376]AFY38411.1 metal dependent phosphohydrolase [[Leptolyngbya] sp. PCC 7376]
MELSDRFSEALVFAEKLHRQQSRKGSGTPYVAHLLGVASTVLEAGGNEDEAIAALLHDAVEDQGGLATRDLIQEKFGDRVTEIVMGCSDSVEGEIKLPWRERKVAYLDHLKTAPKSVRLVSMADKLYNLQSIVRDYRLVGEDLWSRFRGKKDGTLWYYQELSKIFDPEHPLTQEFKRAIATLDTLISTKSP